ncbi:UNVERIFIED_CONTAM: hypothetical protein K2H54_066066 [Gekko kuhli]
MMFPASGKSIICYSSMTLLELQGLKIVHHADKTLASFCKWQKSINPKSDTNALHHDVAVLLTSDEKLALQITMMDTPSKKHNFLEKRYPFFEYVSSSHNL